MVKLIDIFDLSYGNKFDLNKMVTVKKNDPNAVNFVSRTSKNLGVVATVKIIGGVEPYQKGLITVAFGGAILSSFVQQKEFYTAQNIAVLKPKNNMSFQEKLYYCKCIEKNKYRYSTCGREANRTLKELEIPAVIPDWVKDQKIITKDFSAALQSVTLNLSDVQWKPFRYDEIFEIKKGQRIVNSRVKQGKTRCIRPIDKNNGVDNYIDIKPNHSENTITVNYNGSVGEAFYQPKPYFALDDVNVLYPLNFKLNIFIGMFLITLIRKEKYRFNYGRKWKLERMKESIIKLPVDAQGKPNWQYMEDYIKSLPYSVALN